MKSDFQARIKIPLTFFSFQNYSYSAEPCPYRISNEIAQIQNVYIYKMREDRQDMTGLDMVVRALFYADQILGKEELRTIDRQLSIMKWLAVSFLG
jgi:hypothetical protein